MSPCSGWIAYGPNAFASNGSVLASNRRWSLAALHRRAGGAAVTLLGVCEGLSGAVGADAAVDGRQDPVGREHIADGCRIFDSKEGAPHDGIASWPECAEVES